MRLPSYTGQFKRDVKLAEKRGKDMSKLRTVIELLLAAEALPRELGDRRSKENGSRAATFISNRIGC
jgi:mRNA interferase YafQ